MPKKKPKEEPKSLSQRLDDIAVELEEIHADDERAEGMGHALRKMADAVEDIEVDAGDDCE